MNILLLGNGYDLHYKLPTGYQNFLLTVDLLITYGIENIDTVGDVFGDTRLTEKDKMIKRSYDTYKEAYDTCRLNRKNLKEFVDTAKGNRWLSYFIESFNREAGWIDFEREIAFVVNCFQEFFQKAGISFLPGKTFDNDGKKHIIMNVFNFFIKKESSNSFLPVGTRLIKDEYTLEYPQGSGYKKINKEKIVDSLLVDFEELVYLLKEYLIMFVENPMDLLVSQKKIEPFEALKYTDVVVTLNYTNTFEKLSSNDEVYHIHGNVKDKIVLGINSDQNDKKDNIDTSLIGFKKYYQRTFFNTDGTYLRWLRSFLDGEIYGGDTQLLVMGHSLDITDEDIIRDLFGISSQIAILYHDDNAKLQHIRNLVNIFGKEEFDRIRDEQRLEFILTSDDFSEFSRKKYENSVVAYERRIAESGHFIKI